MKKPATTPIRQRGSGLQLVSSTLLLRISQALATVYSGRNTANPLMWKSYPATLARLSIPQATRSVNNFLRTVVLDCSVCSDRACSSGVRSNGVLHGAAE